MELHSGQTDVQPAARGRGGGMHGRLLERLYQLAFCLLEYSSILYGRLVGDNKRKPENIQHADEESRLSPE
jgi:hypothetical protein